MLAAFAADAGGAAFEVAAVETLVGDHGDDRAQKAVSRLTAFLLTGEERVEMPGQALPERRGLGLSGAVCLRNHAAQRRKAVCHLTPHLRGQFPGGEGECQCVTIRPERVNKMERTVHSCIPAASLRRASSPPSTGSSDCVPAASDPCAALPATNLIVGHSATLRFVQ